MEKYITDPRTGLDYELVGDYYLIAGDDGPALGLWVSWNSTSMPSTPTPQPWPTA